MDQVILEYRRVMCDLMWRPLIEKQPEMFNFIKWKEINNLREFDSSKIGKICTEMENFTVFIKIFLGYSRLTCTLIKNYN